MPDPVVREWHTGRGMAFAYPSVTTVLFHGKRKVKMDMVASIAFAFLVGLTACGLAGTTMELASGRKLAFAEPYVSPSHVLRSLGATSVVGPFMLCNEALSAYRENRISAGAMLSCACTALVWIMALGIVLITILQQGAALLG
jgi:hypothetical protein